MKRTLDPGYAAMASLDEPLSAKLYRYFFIGWMLRRPHGDLFTRQALRRANLALLHRWLPHYARAHAVLALFWGDAHREGYCQPPVIPGHEFIGEVVALGEGSGWVYDAQGNIVTNAHVVEGASQIDITFSDGSLRAAEVVGSDPHSDLAIIHVADMPASVNPLRVEPLVSQAHRIAGFVFP